MDGTKPNKEIEFKIKVTDKELDAFKKWARKEANYKGFSDQNEFYLDHPRDSFIFINKEGIKDASTYFRIRFTERGTYTCLKVFHKDYSGDFAYCDEYETEVEDGGMLLNLYKKLGYEVTAHIQKKRERYHYKEFEIDLDTVKGVGTFIEIEVKKRKVGVKEGQDLIRAFLKSIGMKKIKRQSRGYVSMVWNPGYNFNQVEHLE